MLSDTEQMKHLLQSFLHQVFQIFLFPRIPLPVFLAIPGTHPFLNLFWTKLNIENATLQKTSSNTSITDDNGNYSVAGATYGVFADKDCTKLLAPLRLMKAEILAL